MSRAGMRDARGRLRGSRWRGQIPVPPHAHPLVRALIGVLNDQQTLLSEAAERSGVSLKTVSDWRYRITPTVVTLDAVARTVGYRLALVPAEDAHAARPGVDRRRLAILRALAGGEELRPIAPGSRAYWWGDHRRLVQRATVQSMLDAGLIAAPDTERAAQRRYAISDQGRHALDAADTERAAGAMPAGREHRESPR